MKLVTMAGTLILILVAAVAVQGLVLQRRAKKIGNLEYSLQKAETSLAEERKRGEIYRARVEELQVNGKKTLCGGGGRVVGGVCQA